MLEALRDAPLRRIGTPVQLRGVEAAERRVRVARRFVETFADFRERESGVVHKLSRTGMISSADAASRAPHSSLGCAPGARACTPGCPSGGPSPAADRADCKRQIPACPE